MGSDDPYAGMTDLQVFNRARDALRARDKLAPGCVQYRIQQSVFDAAMLELGWRAIRHIIARTEAE